MEKNMFAFGSPTWWLPPKETRKKMYRFEGLAKRGIFVGVHDTSSEILVLHQEKVMQSGTFRVDESGYFVGERLKKISPDKPVDDAEESNDDLGTIFYQDEKMEGGDLFLTDEEKGGVPMGSVYFSGEGVSEACEIPASVDAKTDSSIWDTVTSFFAGEEQHDRRAIQHRPAPRKLHKLFFKAKRKELLSFVENKCIREPTKERRSGGKPISTKWVLTLKPLQPGETCNWSDLRRGCGVDISDKIWRSYVASIPHDKHGNALVKPKARLVARGFEEKLARGYAASPTVSAYMIRMAMAVASLSQRVIACVDIPNAFLRGDTLPRSPLLQVPEELSVVLSLNSNVGLAVKPIYGINDAPLRFWSRIDRYMTNGLGLLRLPGDACVWYDDAVIILAHVDDILIIASAEWIRKNLDGKIMTDWGITERHDGNFTHCGVDIIQGEDGLRLTQESYVDTIEEIQVTPEELEGDLSDELLQKCQQVCGELNWVATRTRPDLSFLVGEAISLFSYKEDQAGYSDGKQSGESGSEVQELLYILSIFRRSEI